MPCTANADTAALLLVAAGDHPERLRSEAAWAHLCGVAPIPASSGKVRRHRLNLRGNREANHALWRIVITRMSSHPPRAAAAEITGAQGRQAGDPALEAAVLRGPANGDRAIGGLRTAVPYPHHVAS